jgi:hypothetical protein
MNVPILLGFLAVAVVVLRATGFKDLLDSHVFQKIEPQIMEGDVLTSSHMQTSQDYYKLPFFKPTDGSCMVNQNLGQLLTGNKIQSSAYHINMLTKLLF